MNFNRPYATDCNGGKVDADYCVQEQNGITYISFAPNRDEKIKEIILFSGKHNYPPDTTLYGDGYQKLSQYRGTLSRIKTITGYTDSGHYKMPETKGYSTVYNYAVIGSGSSAVLIGAASCRRFRTEIRFNADEMQVVQCLEELEFRAGEKVTLEDTVLLRGEKNAILNVFAELIEKNHPKKTFHEMPVGWCSWYCIGPNITEKSIFDNLTVIKEKTPELKYIQIDDGFQPFMGDWLETSDKFNRPMKDICLDIKKAGFEPAIWLAPFIASPKSRLLREHPEYFVKDVNGAPLCSQGVTFGGWRDGPWYMIDGTNPAAQKFIFDTVSEIYHNWGVKYYKLDANVWGALPFGVRYNKHATAIEAYRTGMDAIWRATGGDAFILGCNAPMWPSLGAVSAMRVTNDVVRKISHMSNLGEQCFHRNWMHNKLWVNDPDCLIMADTKASVMDPNGSVFKSRGKKKFYKLNCIYVRASGGMILSGDYVHRYVSADTSRLKKLLKSDYAAAEFDDGLEIGRAVNGGATEYYIFNRSKLFKKYKIAVPKGCGAYDMYNDKNITVSGEELTVCLTKYNSAWIKITDKQC